MTTEIVPIPKTTDNRIDRLLYDKFHWYDVEYYAQVGQGKCLLTNRYEQLKDKLENFKVNDDDIWVCSFPRSGTTWTQEMVWCIYNNLDFNGAQQPITQRYAFLEFEFFVSGTVKCDSAKYDKRLNNSIAFAENFPPPRFIKTHLPWELLPREIRCGVKKPRIIYVSRDPRDACCSYYHHHRLIHGHQGSLEEFAEMFLNDRVMYGPYWANVRGYTEQVPHRSHVLYLEYREMEQQLAAVIEKTARFLGKNLDATNIKILAQHLSFETMRDNRAVNYDKYSKENSPNLKFMRKGKSDTYLEEMSDEIKRKFDTWIRANSL